jgi:hypothetical protein
MKSVFQFIILAWYKTSTPVCLNLSGFSKRLFAHERYSFNYCFITDDECHSPLMMGIVEYKNYQMIILSVTVQAKTDQPAVGLMARL